MKTIMRLVEVLAAGYLAICSLLPPSTSATETRLPADSVQKSLWNGYERLDFQVDG